MQVVKTITDVKEIITQKKRQRKTIGFVPTMGFLHEGHLSLVKRAREETDFLVMSIFVNPTQFGPGEDYESYPRDEKRDLALAKSEGVDLVFMPEVAEMYPRLGSIEIFPGKQANELCGKSRPGHFDGVLKVILKLFNIVQADRAYFGMKDAQQLAIIETFVEDFNFNTKIERVATVREEDGLAKSSRNVKLLENERLEAPVIYQALLHGKKLLDAGENSLLVEQAIKKYLLERISGTIDYVSILAYPSLEPLTTKDQEAILAIAVQYTNARLIDNLILPIKG